MTDPEQRLAQAGWRRSFRMSADLSVSESELIRWRDPAEPNRASMTEAEAIRELDRRERKAATR